MSFVMRSKNEGGVLPAASAAALSVTPGPRPSPTTTYQSLTVLKHCRIACAERLIDGVS